MQRKVDRIDLGEPIQFLALDPSKHTVRMLEHHILEQLGAQGMDGQRLRAVARRGALELYALGWRSSDGIFHMADNPIPRPQPPHLPKSPLRLAA